jgi:hypothetical protein
MKSTDPIDEVRSVREEHAKKFGYDLNRIAEDIQKSEERLLSDGWKLVRRKRTSNKAVESIPLRAPRSTS